METSLPEGWVKSIEFRYRWAVLSLILAFLLCSLFYTFHDSGWSFWPYFLLLAFMIAVLVGLYETFHIWMFRMDISRRFRLRGYEDLTLGRRIPRFKRDLMADPIGARRPRMAGGDLSEYYLIGEDPRALIGVAYEDDWDAFHVIFHLVPATYHYTRQVERFAREKGWKEE